MFLKILRNILKKYLQFRLERPAEWNIPQFFGEDGIQQIFFSDDPSTYYPRLQEAFKDLGMQQVQMLLKGSIPFRQKPCQFYCACVFNLIYFSFNMITYYNRFRQYLL